MLFQLLSFLLIRAINKYKNLPWQLSKIFLLLIFFGNLSLIAKPINKTLCSLNGIKLFGNVKVVTAFADFKVQRVTSFPDLKVRDVKSFPDKCGKWKFVKSFPDFTVQYVNSFADFKIKEVKNFPGLP